jgi:hypothetical protein
LSLTFFHFPKVFWRFIEEWAGGTNQNKPDGRRALCCASGVLREKTGDGMREKTNRNKPLIGRTSPSGNCLGDVRERQ